LLGDLGRAAEMIAVKMREQEVIDAREAGGFRGGDDARRIAPAGIAGVDQHGLAGGRDEEGRATTLGIDPVGVEGSGFLVGEERHREARSEKGQGNFQVQREARRVELGGRPVRGQVEGLRYLA
jgi:hypothetical protein